MSKYTIVENEFKGYDVKEKTRTNTGVRWITIENYVDKFETLEEAKKKYPKAEVLNLGEQWWDNLVKKENTPSNPDM
tara:strand:- start:90 stop:320 length:231 start_codon:yes stop_codon:yes gene_type:complete